MELGAMGAVSTKEDQDERRNEGMFIRHGRMDPFELRDFPDTVVRIPKLHNPNLDALLARFEQQIALLNETLTDTPEPALRFGKTAQRKVHHALACNQLATKVAATMEELARALPAGQLRNDVRRGLKQIAATRANAFGLK